VNNKLKTEEDERYLSKKIENERKIFITLYSHLVVEKK